MTKVRLWQLWLRKFLYLFQWFYGKHWQCEGQSFLQQSLLSISPYLKRIGREDWEIIVKLWIIRVLLTFLLGISLKTFSLLWVFFELILSHTRRQCNFVAHALLRKTRNSFSLEVWMESIPYLVWLFFIFHVP